VFLERELLAKVRNFSAIRRGVALLVLLAALVLLAWGYWPFEDQTNSLLLSPADMQPAQWPSGLQPAGLPAGLAARRLELTYPSVVRVGDIVSVRLTLAPVAQGETLPGETSTGQPAPTQASPGGYAVIAEGWLDMAGFEYTPPGRTDQALLAGRPLTFVWRGRPEHSGVFEGVAWLHLNYLTPDNRLAARQVLSAQRIHIRATRLLGISGNLARLLGSACLVLGIVFGLDGVALWILRKWQK
jgi:hypothetical protein